MFSRHAPSAGRIPLVTLALLGAMGAGFAKPVSPRALTDAGSSPVQVADPFADEDRPRTDSQFTTSPAPLPPNMSSLGFHDTGTAEFGDLIRLAGPAHFIESITVTLSSWALHSDFPALPRAGFAHPVTLNIYAPEYSGGRARPGKLLATQTRRFLIPFRPEPDPMAASALRPWRGPDGSHFPGVAFNIRFDLDELELSLPDEVIVAVAFDTQHHGIAPLAVPGAYNSLHVGLSEQPANPGTDVEPDAVFWKSSRAEHYTDAGAAGWGVLRRDTGWAPYKPAIRVNNSAYGMIFAVDTLLRTIRTDNAAIEAKLDDLADLTELALDRRNWQTTGRLEPAAGAVVFELLEDAALEFEAVAQSAPPLATDARQAISALLSAAESIAEVAVGDALFAGGNALRLSQAEGSLAAGATSNGPVRSDQAIEAFGAAWREAQRSLP
ncbi:MAG: hypothetical protein Q7S40_02810 [Opitutaceae bacterium]|nr:hypothetical protein [Opitutaceae bacterium]